MKTFIFLHNTTQEHLLIDANTATEALFIIASKHNMCNYTFKGAASEHIKVGESLNNVIANIKAAVAFDEANDYNISDIEETVNKAINTPVQSAIAEYTRVMVLFKIKPVVNNSVKCDTCFNDMYLNASFIKQHETLADAVKDALDYYCSSNVPTKLKLIEVLELKAIGDYTAKINKMYAVAFTSIFPIINDTITTFNSYAKQACIIKHGTFTHKDIVNSIQSPDNNKAAMFDPAYKHEIVYQRYIICVKVTANDNKYRDYLDIYVRADTEYIVNDYLDESKALDLFNDYYKDEDYIVNSLITRNYEGTYVSSSYEASYYVANSDTILAERSESCDITAINKLLAASCDKFKAVTDKTKK